MNKILLIEDDATLGDHLAQALRAQGIEVHWEQTIEGLRECLEQRIKYDLVMLDRLLDDSDTKSLLPAIKKVWSACHVFVISAINTHNERIELINMGADDYIGKPFSTQEVVARAKSLLRRSGMQTSRYIKLGQLVIDQINRSISVGEVSEQLPAKEFLLLKILSQEAGRVWSKESLLDSVWGSSFAAETNVVEATITHLRRRLLQIGSNVKIQNMRNSGYWIEA